MRNLFKQLHLWLSIPFGILITLICFSGAMLVFEKEIVRTVRSDYFRVEPVGEVLPIDRLVGIVAATLPDDVQATGITVPTARNEAYQVSLSKPHRASVYIDPYTGEVKGLYQRPAFFATMFRLHRWLLGSRPDDGGIFWGKVIVGTSTLLFVVVLLTGVVLWWPRTKKVLANSLRLTVRKGWHRFWYSLHVTGGMYTLILLLLMALTGLTWSFDWYRTGFYSLFGVELQGQGGQGQGQGDRGHGSQERNAQGRGDKPLSAHWQKVYDELHRLNPDCKQITLSRGSASVSFSGLGNQRAADRYTFHPRTGEVTGVTLYRDSAPSGKLRGWIYSVHVGSFGGWVTRVLWCLAALLGATLPLTGYYLWIRRLVRRKS